MIKNPFTNPHDMEDDAWESLHPSIQGVLRFFVYDHLSPNLQMVSRGFCRLAVGVAFRAGSNHTPQTDGPETTVALRKLLEAKDAAVRAFVVANDV